MPNEISSIAPPKPKNVKGKVVLGNRVHATENPEAIDFTYDLSEYNSYEQNGFTPPANNERSDRVLREFLHQADLSQGPIKVRILSMVRLRALDSDSDTRENKEMKEYVYLNAELYAKTWLGEDIRYGNDFFTGRYMRQTKVLKNDIDMKTGKLHSYYVKGNPEVAYNLPFSKENVDKYLLNPHPFGQDSLNITDKDSVVYYGKFTNTDTGTYSHDDDTYSYSQFCTSEWRDFCDLSSRQGGPRAKTNAKYRVVAENEEQTKTAYQ